MLTTESKTLDMSLELIAELDAEVKMCNLVTSWQAENKELAEAMNDIIHQATCEAIDELRRRAKQVGAYAIVNLKVQRELNANGCALIRVTGSAMRLQDKA